MFIQDGGCIRTAEAQCISFSKRGARKRPSQRHFQAFVIAIITVTIFFLLNQSWHLCNLRPCRRTPQTEPYQSDTNLQLSTVFQARARVYLDDFCAVWAHHVHAQHQVWLRVHNDLHHCAALAPWNCVLHWPAPQICQCSFFCIWLAFANSWILTWFRWNKYQDAWLSSVRGF